MMSEGAVEGTLLRRGDPGYEYARTGAVWNGLKPGRFPAAVVRPASEADVSHALAHARSHGLRVSTVSGGHNWSGSPLRDGGLLMDLSRFTQCRVDPGPATATVGPAATGRDLVAALGPHGLAFPVGHCPSVAVGGYLLSGGLGWNSRAWGAACADVQEIRAVTADGRTVNCSGTENSDLFWAARGAGPGFFAVVTRFRLRLHARPASIMTTSLAFPLSDTGRVTCWAERIARELPPNVETSLVLLASAGAAPGAPDPSGARIVVGATAFAAAPEAALDSLAPVVGCPFVTSAVSRQPPEPTSFAALHAGAAALWPPGHRYAADTLWSAETYENRLTRAADAIAHAPSGRSLVLAPVQPVSEEPALLRGMAFAPLGESYHVCYAVWDDPAEDEANTRWLREAMATADPSGRGGRYVAEADLEAGPDAARLSYSPAAWDRLRELKARWDPENLFHSYLAP
ncbi:FAD-binding oxidoreductase [Streptomyces sp. NPDC049577]|uniref:FAD-binding oxidoreductase n=1 Tax=Streptomyces sp. NPDC049577 TaxID=3155153 RepID=UPI003415852F